MAMELSRISAVLDCYERTLQDVIAMDEAASWVEESTTLANRLSIHFRHIVDDMIPAMRQMIARGAACNREKLMRWYGFIQGQLVAFGVFDLEQVKQHSNPDVPPPKHRSVADDEGESK